MSEKTPEAVHNYHKDRQYAHDAHPITILASQHYWEMAECVRSLIAERDEARGAVDAGMRARMKCNHSAHCSNGVFTAIIDDCPACIKAERDALLSRIEYEGSGIERMDGDGPGIPYEKTCGVCDGNGSIDRLIERAEVRELQAKLKTATGDYEELRQESNQAISDMADLCRAIEEDCASALRPAPGLPAFEAMVSAVLSKLWRRRELKSQCRPFFVCVADYCAISDEEARRLCNVLSRDQETGNRHRDTTTGGEAVIKCIKA